MKNLAKALYYKYYKEGASISTRGDDIVRWDGVGQPQPDPSKFPTIIAEYEQHVADEKVAKKNRKKDVLQKLGLNKNDIQGLVELIKDQDDE